MTKCRSKVKEPWSSSITSANAIAYLSYKFPSTPDSLLDLSQRKSLRGNHILQNESVYKSQLHFPSQNNRTCTKLTYK